MTSGFENDLKMWVILLWVSPDAPLTEQDVYNLQETWGQAIKDISTIYLNDGDYMARANEAAAELYAYGTEDILFKPTKAAEYPFRPREKWQKIFPQNLPPLRFASYTIIPRQDTDPIQP